jgi:2-aminoethylphosphonate-pyruvate transaminase
MNKYKLLTPGPITTTQSVKEAMMIDQCTWDEDYKEIIKNIQTRILNIAHCDQEKYTCVLMTGSGTYANEAVLSSVIGNNDKLLVIESGVYGARLGILADYSNISYSTYQLEYNFNLDIKNIEEILLNDIEITHVVMVHVESTFGFENDLKGISKLCSKYDKKIIVDAMSSFGALDFDVQQLNINYLITTPNKALEAIPGLSIIICLNEDIEECEGNANTFSLNLYLQYKSMRKHKFRFTSPTYNVLALHQALKELEIEGGVEKRHQRYLKINNAIMEMMKKYNIYRFVDSEYQSVILNCFTLNNQNFEFEELYKYFRNNGYELYPGKMTSENTFRIGNIGEINQEDVNNLDKLMKNFINKNII